MLKVLHDFFKRMIITSNIETSCLFVQTGRGRGEGGFYQRSIEDAEVGFGRSVREIHRSQSWDDR